VARARGGHARGGAHLTPAGRDLVRRYTRFRRRLDTTLRRLYASAFAADAR
jgi:molybdate transport repressor ModE-like protein